MNETTGNPTFSRKQSGYIFALVGMVVFCCFGIALWLDSLGIARREKPSQSATVSVTPSAQTRTNSTGASTTSRSQARNIADEIEKLTIPTPGASQAERAAVRQDFISTMDTILQITTDASGKPRLPRVGSLVRLNAADGYPRKKSWRKGQIWVARTRKDFEEAMHADFDSNTQTIHAMARRRQLFLVPYDTTADVLEASRRDNYVKVRLRNGKWLRKTGFVWDCCAWRI